MKKITGQCFSNEVKAACTHSANLEREMEKPKIVTYPPFPLASSIGSWFVLLVKSSMLFFQ